MNAYITGSKLVIEFRSHQEKVWFERFCQPETKKVELVGELKEKVYSIELSSKIEAQQ